MAIPGPSRPWLYDVEKYWRYDFLYVLSRKFFMVITLTALAII
jgi:hypothetical protein